MPEFGLEGLHFHYTINKRGIYGRSVMMRTEDTMIMNLILQAVYITF